MIMFDDTIHTVYQYPITNKVARTTKNPAYKSGNASMVRKVTPAAPPSTQRREGGGTDVPGYTCTCQ